MPIDGKSADLGFCGRNGGGCRMRQDPKNCDSSVPPAISSQDASNYIYRNLKTELHRISIEVARSFGPSDHGQRLA